MITKEQLAYLLKYEPYSGEFFWINPRTKWQKPGDKAGHICKEGYVIIRLYGINYKAHRLAWLYETGTWPKEEIDHINGVRSDNRIFNLREATRSQNQQNQKIRSDNRVGLKGVSRVSGCNDKWQVFVTESNKKIYIGIFSSPEDAHKAYIKASKKLYGEYSRAG